MKSGTLIVLLMAFSRMHNGMHYPSDVIAGVGFGILAGYLSVFAVNYKKAGKGKVNKFKRHK